MVRIIVNYIQKDQRQGQKFRHQLEVYGLLPRLVEITHNWIQFSVLKHHSRNSDSVFQRYFIDERLTENRAIEKCITRRRCEKA